MLNGKAAKGEASQKTCLCATYLSLLSGKKAQVKRVGAPVGCVLFSNYLFSFHWRHLMVFLNNNLYMRKFTLLVAAAVLSLSAAKGQTVSTFEGLTLAGTDTAYINYSAPGEDVGFSNGLVYFPCVYDTSGGYEYWSYGFAYSNMTDSVTSGFMNQYSAKTAIGYGASAKYAVAYGTDNSITLQGAAAGATVNGFYITNSTYAYNSMRDGDTYAKKFGDTTGTGLTTGQGTAPDWFLLTIRGYNNSVASTDSVNFYLADFRGATASDYILNTWQWVDLTSLGHVDSISFKLTSSDNSFGFMNTPAYFCIDDFKTNETLVNVGAATTVAAKVYPNPATDRLYVDLADDNCQQVTVFDVRGAVVYSQNISSRHIELNTSTLSAGAYTLALSGAKNATMRFVKQ